MCKASAHPQNHTKASYAHTRCTDIMNITQHLNSMELDDTQTWMIEIYRRLGVCVCVEQIKKPNVPFPLPNRISLMRNNNNNVWYGTYIVHDLIHSFIFRLETDTHAWRTWIRRIRIESKISTKIENARRRQRCDDKENKIGFPPLCHPNWIRRFSLFFPFIVDGIKCSSFRIYILSWIISPTEEKDSTDEVGIKFEDI